MCCAVLLLQQWELEAAWYHSSSIEDSLLKLCFSIHDTETELVTVHSAEQVKRTKLPSVLLSCTTLFWTNRKTLLQQQRKLTSLTSSRFSKPWLCLIFQLLKCGVGCQNILLSELQAERVCHLIIYTILFNLFS